MRTLRVRIIASAIAIAGCQAVFGINGGTLSEGGPNQPCDERNNSTSCANGLTCVQSLCRKPCTRDDECASEERCHTTDSHMSCDRLCGGCIPTAGAPCDPQKPCNNGMNIPLGAVGGCGKDCPPGQTCNNCTCAGGTTCAQDGQCRAFCDTMAGTACGGGQTCVSDAIACKNKNTMNMGGGGVSCSGACYGSPPHDNGPGNTDGSIVGGPWTKQTSGTPNVLTGVWGSGPTNVYVVAGDGNAPPGILYSNGDGNWAPQSSGTSNGLTAVWGSGPADVYAVSGGGNANNIAHADGGAFTARPSGTGDLYGVWGSGPADVYAVGVNGAIVHSTGNDTWTKQVAPSIGNNFLRGVWGSASNDIYVVGPSGNFLHSDGSTWTAPSLAPNELRGVWGSGPNDVYAVGVNGMITHKTATSGFGVQSSNTGEELHAVWGSGPSDVYAVGNKGTIVHSSGGGVWTRQSVPVAADLYGVWGSGPNDVYVVGSSGVILHHP